MNPQQEVQMNPEVRPPVPLESDTTFNMFQSKNGLIVILVVLLVLSFLGINILLVIGNFFQAIINIFGPLVYQILGVFGYTAGSVLNKTANVVTDTTKTGLDIADGTVQSVGNLLLKSSGAVVDPNAKRLLDNAVNTPIRVQIPTAAPIKVPVPVEVKVPVPVEVKVPVPVSSCSPGSSNLNINFNSLLNNPITRFLTYDPNKSTSAPTQSVTSAPTQSVTSAPTQAVTSAPTQAVTSAPTQAVTSAPTQAVTSAPIQATTVPVTSAPNIQNPITSNKISWCFSGEFEGKRGCVEVQDQAKCLSGQVFPSQQACLATTSSSDPLVSSLIVPTMPAAVPNYGNGTIMMNGLPMSPIPPPAPTMQQLVATPSGTAKKEPFSQLATTPPLLPNPTPGAVSQLHNAAPINRGSNNAPFLPYIPPQTNPMIIQADGPPLVNGPLNYFYTYSDRKQNENKF